MLSIPLSVLHVLRLTGLSLCLLHFFGLLSMVRAIRAEGGGTPELLVSISTGSLALIVGMMLVLLSLLLQSIPTQQMDGSLGYRLPIFYVITRPLLILIAVVYLAIIPCQMLANQKLRSAGMANLERGIERQRELINRMASLSSRDDGVPAANKILDQVQLGSNISIPVRPSTPQQFQIVLEKLSRQLELDKIQRIRSADSHLAAKTMIVFVSSLVNGLLILFYWLQWPQKVRLVVIDRDEE